jgi:hypothetical protein
MKPLKASEYPRPDETRTVPPLSEAPGSASYDLFLGNNDYDTTGMTPAEAVNEAAFELRCAQSAVLFLQHGMTKAEALKAVDNLRWLVEKSDLPNTTMSNAGAKTET